MWNYSQPSVEWNYTTQVLQLCGKILLQTALIKNSIKANIDRSIIADFAVKVFLHFHFYQLAKNSKSDRSVVYIILGNETHIKDTELY